MPLNQDQNDKPIQRWIAPKQPVAAQPEVVHHVRKKFQPDWAATKPHSEWPSEEEWPRIVVTCRTMGCENNGYPIEMPYIGQPIFCGPCSARLD
jgi:hypothetical protein